MTDERTLLEAIAANPEDDTVRLVFADFLAESDQHERAEFIRNQVELARMSLNDPARRPLVIRNRHFLNAYVPAWRAELPQLTGIEWGDFNRGLVEEVQARTEAEIVRYADLIFAEPAIHVIRLARFKEGRQLASLRALMRVRALRLIGAQAIPEKLTQLLASPFLANLAVLDLHGNNLGDYVVGFLIERSLPALTELWLGENRITNSGGRALSQTTHFQQLRLLDLRDNWITDLAVRAALSQRFGAQLKL